MCATPAVAVESSGERRFCNQPLRKLDLMTDYLDWPGLSGRPYRYYFLPNISAGAVKAEPGNYVFAKRLPNGNWAPIYFGKAENLSARLSQHEQWEPAKRQGATHVFAHTSTGTEQSRLAEERDLIQRWNPPLNVHHKRVG